ncbi:MAG TPA: CGNR zinc finger domain-containing protein, partial [Thermodesulfobacteriota bacterium]|nr:CGNR zinc finger domain-containing protein [Thermodesulfobacteriota bacterium]
EQHRNDIILFFYSSLYSYFLSSNTAKHYKQDVFHLRVLVSVARSAAELIEEGAAAPTRKCGNPNCVLYFYDVSPTRHRRWCSMAVCGNRMKVAAYAHRNQKRNRSPK